MFAQSFEQVSNEYPRVVFATVDTDAEHDLASELGITSVPFFMIFRDQVLLYAQPGMLPASALGLMVSQIEQLDVDAERLKVERVTVAIGAGG
jgi:thioredoxin 1